MIIKNNITALHFSTSSLKKFVFHYINTCFCAKFSFTCLFLFLFIEGTALAQHQVLRREIAEIAHSSSGRVGVAINLLEVNDTLTFHDQERYPMHSVFKFPIAMMLLYEIDKGKFKLDQTVYVTNADLRKTVSALYDKYPQGNANVTYEELLTDMIILSDNDACDILIRELGGAKKVSNFIYHWGVDSLSIQVNETEMSKAWPAQYRNWCNPSAQISLLKILYQQNLLSKQSNALLLKLMLKTSVSPKRLRGLLPVGTPVAHRTGTSSTNEQGLSPATNDVGIITLPNGKHLAIAVFVTDSHDDMDIRESIIAKLAKAAYIEYSN